MCNAARSSTAPHPLLQGAVANPQSWRRTDPVSTTAAGLQTHRPPHRRRRLSAARARYRTGRTTWLHRTVPGPPARAAQPARHPSLGGSSSGDTMGRLLLEAQPHSLGNLHSAQELCIPGTYPFVDVQSAYSTLCKHPPSPHTSWNQLTPLRLKCGSTSVGQHPGLTPGAAAFQGSADPGALARANPV